MSLPSLASRAAGRAAAVALLLCVTAAGASAADTPAATPSGPPAAAAPATASAGVLAPIEQLNAALIRIMQAGKQVAFQKRVDMLAPAIDQAFDLPQILRVSVGPGWSAISAAQQTTLLDVFRRYTIASYVDNFDGYDGQKFDVAPAPRVLPGGQQVVLTRIVSPSGEAHQLDYVMRQVNGAWKAVDVLADGSISRVAVQRSDFRQLLDQGGAAALEASLAKKVKDLSGS